MCEALKGVDSCLGVPGVNGMMEQTIVCVRRVLTDC